MKGILWITWCLLLCLVVIGCQKVTDTNGKTGWGISEGLDRFLMGAGDANDKHGKDLAGGVSVFNAVAGMGITLLTGIGGSLFTGYKAWRKPLMEKGKLLDKISQGAKAAADVIDKHLKTEANKENWENIIKPQLKAAEKAGAIMPDKV